MKLSSISLLYLIVNRRLIAQRKMLILPLDKPLKIAKAHEIWQYETSTVTCLGKESRVKLYVNILLDVNQSLDQL